MKLGAVIPQPELGPDPDDLTRFVQSAEELGYDYVVLYEIMLKTKDIVHGDASHPSSPDNWHDPFTLISYLAGKTTRINFTTGVSILPSRPTLQIAKQIAGADRLSKGRLRLGVSVGWNNSEYAAMGKKFGNRGSRIEEQIRILRELFENDVVTFEGKYHNLDHVSLGIRPIQNSIPIWMGGYADRVLRRTATLCDGWCANIVPFEKTVILVENLKNYIIEVGRRIEDVGMSFCATLNEPEAWRKNKIIPQDWELFKNQHLEIGATDLEISTSHFGSLKTVEEHIDAITRFKDRVQ